MVATSDIVSNYIVSNYFLDCDIFLGSPTSVVCQKDGLIIAVTSVFFESFVPLCFVRHWNGVSRSF
jgi:hypothetical protein